nr:putative ribonuclease H-like domain-containing protein [Tanacetum cinerariifolium]
KADEGYLVGYASNSKAYRVYNLTNKRVEETMNLRFMEDKPNVQRIGHECFVGPSSSNGPSVTERNADYAEELARLQRQEHEAKDAAERYGYFTEPAGSIPAASISISADSILVYVEATTLPPGQSLGSSKNTTRFPVPSDSQIIGDLASPIQTRSKAQKSKFGESAFIGYLQDRQRTNHTDQLHYLFACFLTQLEPTSIAKALEDPELVAAMQEEMQQFINQEVWKLVPLLEGKYAIGTKWILKKKRDARGIVVRNKVRLVAQGHRQEEGIDYDELMCWLQKIIRCWELLKRLRFIPTDKVIQFLLMALCVPAGSSSCDSAGHIEAVFAGYDIVPAGHVLGDPRVDNDLASRPDIMFAVSACSRHQVTPLTSHLNAVKKIFKYLKGQPNLGLWYPHDSPFQLEAYTNSNYAGSHGDRKSISGGCQFLGRRLISWQCKKQTIVATSSTEAETKHIEIRHHFIRDANEKNLIQVLKIHTDDNVADLLTKAFDGPRFEFLVVHIGMVVITAASCTFFLLTGWFLLVVICFCWWLSFLLDALFLLVAMDYAGSYVFLLVGILRLVDSFPLAYFCWWIHFYWWVCVPAVFTVSADC